jgi:hypothetical protein
VEEGLVGGQGIVVVVVVQARQLVAQQENGTCVSRHLRRSCSVRHLNAQSPLLLALRNLTSSSHEGVVGPGSRSVAQGRQCGELRWG